MDRFRKYLTVVNMCCMQYRLISIIILCYIMQIHLRCADIGVVFLCSFIFCFVDTRCVNKGVYTACAKNGANSQFCLYLSKALIESK